MDGRSTHSGKSAKNKIYVLHNMRAEEAHLHSNMNVNKHTKLKKRKHDNF